MTSSSAVQNSEACFRPRPAPLIPVMLSTTTPVVSISPACTSGASASVAAVTWQPGVAISSASLSWLRCSSGRPNTARSSSSGWSCSKPYHVGYSEASFSRYAAERSTTQRTRPTSCGRQGHARLVRQPEEHHVGRAGASDVELLEHQVRVAAGEARVQRRGQRAGLGVAGGVDHLELGVLGAQAQQLGAGVTRRADDRDLQHRRMMIRAHACPCKASRRDAAPRVGGRMGR